MWPAGPPIPNRQDGKPSEADPSGKAEDGKGSPPHDSGSRGESGACGGGSARVRGVLKLRWIARAHLSTQMGVVTIDNSQI